VENMENVESRESVENGKCGNNVREHGN